LLAVVIGSGYGGWKWYQIHSIPPGEASAVLQVPHDLMKRAHFIFSGKVIMLLMRA